MRYRLIMLLCCLLSSCAHFAPFPLDSLPHIGWSDAQVDRVMGESWDVSQTRSGYELRRYGLARTYRFLQAYCGNTTSTCISVLLYQGRVAEVTMTPWF